MSSTQRASGAATLLHARRLRPPPPQRRVLRTRTPLPSRARRMPINIPDTRPTVHLSTPQRMVLLSLVGPANVIIQLTRLPSPVSIPFAPTLPVHLRHPCTHSFSVPIYFTLCSPSLPCTIFALFWTTGFLSCSCFPFVLLSTHCRRRCTIRYAFSSGFWCSSTWSFFRTYLHADSFACAYVHTYFGFRGASK